VDVGACVGVNLGGFVQGGFYQAGGRQKGAGLAQGVFCELWAGIANGGESPVLCGLGFV
jgi:hypothetical protein